MSGRTIVGRAAEMSALSACMDRAIKGTGQVVLLSGEAGMGRSGLVSNLSREAVARGMRVCLGECAPNEAGIPYSGFQRALSDIVPGALFSMEETTHFDEVFLISKIGLLIAHVSHSREGGMDEDILGSMLTAVQDFVKDSFGGQGGEPGKGGLGKLEYLDTKIFIEHGETAFLAAVASGREHPDMKAEIRKCLADVESRYFDLLTDWDGDVDAVSGSVDILGTLVSRSFRMRRSLENVNIESERLKVQNRILEALQACAGEKPALVVLEDLHWADESTLLAVRFVARNISQDRVVLCLTYRTGEEEAAESLGKVIEGLSSEPGCVRVQLEPLDPESVRALISNMLDGRHPPDELVASLVAGNRGNPFFVTEAVQALLSDGTLAMDGDVWILRRDAGAAIPGNVVGVVSRRLESLDLDSLRLVEYGAILGTRFGIGLLASGFHMTESQVRDVASHLVAAGIWELSGDDVAFHSTKVQEVIYAGMNDRFRRMAHRNAGQVLEGMYAGRTEEALFQLAYHFGRTRDHAKGIEYCIAAGQKASDNLAPHEACRFLERAVELMEDSETRDARLADLNRTLGELREIDGDFAGSLAALDKALASDADATSRAGALMVRGRVLQSQGRYEDAIAAYEEGIALAGDAGSRLLEAKINGYLGKIHLRKGDYERAMEMQRAYLAESRNAGDRREMGQAYMNLGGVFYHMSDYDTAIINWRSALEHFTAAGYDQGVAFINDNLGVVYMWQGRFDESLACYTESERMMTRVGDVKGMSSVLLNIGILHDRMGEQDKALDYYRRSLQVKKKIGDVIGAANIYNNIGAAYFDMEKYADAEASYILNLKVMEDCGDTWGVARALSNLAEVKCEMNLHDDARADCARSKAIAEEHDFKDILSTDLRVMGILASSEGEYEIADAHFRAASDLALGIEDPQQIGMTHLSWARSLARRGESVRAVDEYSLALKTFDESGMTVFSRKARTEMQAVVGQAGQVRD